mmetsp:Transcript_25291/g.66118  ORF Transcript_25291/g.66118 Transcript_25291/m.66118 type:complete len:471 (-) Transcript_25291:161-1573(-)
MPAPPSAWCMFPTVQRRCKSRTAPLELAPEQRVVMPISVRGWLRYLLFFAPAHLLAGIALGGMTATIGATFWWLHYTGRTNLWDQVNKMEKLIIIDSPAAPTVPSPGESRVRWPQYTHVVDREHQSGAAGNLAGASAGRDGHSGTKFEIPVPLMMALFGWSASILWASAKTAYRSRIDLELKTFFHEVGFTLLAKRRGAIVQRRLVSRDLKDTLFGNEYLAATLKSACAKVTPADPVVRMPARHASLVVQALQGPLSELSAAEHLASETVPMVDVKHWYALVCSPSTFRTIVVTDGFARELMAQDVDKAGNYSLPTERVLHEPRRGRKKDSAIRSVVSAIQEVEARTEAFDQHGVLSYNVPIPLVGWLNIPLPAGEGGNLDLDMERAADGGRQTRGDSQTLATSLREDGAAHTGADEQLEWVEALEAWEDETAAAVEASLDRTGRTDGDSGSGSATTSSAKPPPPTFPLA